MQRIVVGLDGSKVSEAALRWAAHLAIDSGAKLTAVHSFRRPYAEIPVQEHEAMLAERADILEEFWLRPATELGADVHGQIMEGDPRTTLTNLSETEAPDLLVLGRMGAGGGPGFLHLGSVVEHVAHHTRCPLAVVPADAYGPTRKIALGLDGSDDSRAAAEWVARAAPALDADVLAIQVREPMLEFTPGWDEQNWRRDCERDLTEWTRPIAAAGADVEVLAAGNFHPVDGLLGVAAAHRADLLVIGTRGAGGFGGLRFGGIAMKVLHRATMPLVLVPPLRSR